jgi:DNA repair protein SbcD/Mre11
VHYFSRGRVDEFVVERGGVPIARLLGTSRDKQAAIRPGEFHADATGLLTFAVAHGKIDAEAAASRGIQYWALGGRHERCSTAASAVNSSTAASAVRNNGAGVKNEAAGAAALQTVKGTAGAAVLQQSGKMPVLHYAGSPQGRCPAEAGVYGCTLAQVDEEGQIRTSFIPTDAVRWLAERIVVDREMTQADLETRFRERIATLQQAASKLPLFVTWTIAGGGPLVKQLERGRLADDMLAWLRGEYGSQSPPVWSLAIEVEPSDRFPAEWYEEENIRGDFLREIRRLLVNSEEELDLSDYFPESHQAGTLGATAVITAKTAREKALHEAALLGVALLGGDEAKEEGAL